ncbi:hypothetical protein JTE90_029699 [Oedothorax gibbosus]|uniref:Transmembrane protein n=1 Tax=Oedothorax gibbosus TaxID=931172 RepID=A0AAV6ULS6_9ARAC|nr:hypothetical protein JTE90_029699 [Oedothorax gibbosus]
MEVKLTGIFSFVFFTILHSTISVSLSRIENHDEEISSRSKFVEDQRSKFEMQEETSVSKSLKLFGRYDRWGQLKNAHDHADGKFVIDYWVMTKYGILVTLPEPLVCDIDVTDLGCRLYTAILCIILCFWMCLRELWLNPPMDDLEEGGEPREDIELAPIPVQMPNGVLPGRI